MGKDKLCANPTDVFFKKMKEKEKAKNKKEREKQAIVALTAKPDELRAELDRLEELQAAGRLKNPKLEARLTELRGRWSAIEEREAREKAARSVSIDISRITGKKRSAADDPARPPAFAPPSAYKEGAQPQPGPAVGASVQPASAPPQPAADGALLAVPPGVALPAAPAMPAAPRAPSASAAFVRELPSGIVPPPPPPRPVAAGGGAASAAAAAHQPGLQGAGEQAAAAVPVPAPPREVDKQVLHMVPAALRRRPPPKPPPRPVVPRPAPVAAPQPAHAPLPAPPGSAPPGPPPPRPSVPTPAAPAAPATSGDYASFMNDMAELGAL